MKSLLDFFIEIGKLKKIKRKGWILRRIKNPESIAEHVFRATIMAWFLGQKKGGLDIERLLKTALVHDLCEIYAGDTTPYDSILPKSKKKLQELMKTWPRFSEAEKRKIALQKHEKERKALDKVILSLPQTFKHEIKNLWLDYEKGLTPEGRFFKEADRLENFLQAAEYEKNNKKLSLRPYWLQAQELHDDSILLEFLEQLDKRFHKKGSLQN